MVTSGTTMKRRVDPTFLLWGAAIAAAAGGALWLARRSDAPSSSARPGDSSACPPGSFTNEAGECVVVPTQGKPSPLAIPDHPRVLFVGDRGALLVAQRLNLLLSNYEVESGAPVAPANTTVWDGKGPFSIETMSLAPLPNDVVDAKPDVAVVILGQWNALYGPADKMTGDELVEVLTRLVNLLPAKREGGAPATNIILVKPFAGQYALLVSALCDIAAVRLVPRVYPFGSTIKIALDDTQMYPTEDGALALAQQLAALFVHKGQVAHAQG